jgi:hypothetical protein
MRTASVGLTYLQWWDSFTGSVQQLIFLVLGAS